MAWITRLRRPAELVLGAVFLLAALLKLRDINTFAVQIDGYGVLPSKDLLAPSAIATVSLEVLLGSALVLGWRLRGLVPGLTVGMLVVFTGLIINGWAFHNLESCGCLGFALHPSLSILKNVGLLVLGGIALAGYAGAGAPNRTPTGHLVRGAAAVAAGIVAAGLATGSVETEIAPEARPGAVAHAPAGDEPDAVAAAGPYAQFTFDTDQYGAVDLGDGEYLVALLSATCDHCQASVPALNQLAFFPDLPLVGLVLEHESGEMADFQALTAPQFPLHSLGHKPLAFYKLIGDEPPRLAYVRDGRQVAHWDYDMPTLDTVLAQVEQVRADVMARADETPGA